MKKTFLILATLLLMGSTAFAGGDFDFAGVGSGWSCFSQSALKGRASGLKYISGSALI